MSDLQRKSLIETQPRSALVVEGGALRGVFSTGVLDGFLDAKFNPFDLYVGVSSGASNLAAYLAEMNGRNARIYMDYSLRPEFINFPRFLRGGHLLDLDWLWEITIREIRLDLQKIYEKRKPFVVVMTDIENGRSIYRETRAADLEDVLKASSAMPVFYRDYPRVDNLPMTDGGVIDPIPVGEAMRRGANRIMVIRSRHRHYLKQTGMLDRYFHWRFRNKPRLSQAIASRVRNYNETVALLRRPPAGVSIIEICPPDNFRVSRLTKEAKILQEGYEQGRRQALAAAQSWYEQETP